MIIKMCENNRKIIPLVSQEEASKILGALHKTNLAAKHLQNGGDMLVLYLTNIINNISESKYASNITK